MLWTYSLDVLFVRNLITKSRTTSAIRVWRPYGQIFLPKVPTSLKILFTVATSTLYSKFTSQGVWMALGRGPIGIGAFRLLITPLPRVQLLLDIILSNSRELLIFSRLSRP